MPNSTKDELLKLFNEGREMTLQEMSDRLGVTRKHVRRLRKELEEEDWTIQERWEGGKKHFSLDPKDQQVKSQPIDLKESELQALTVAASAAQATLHPTPFDNHLRDAVQKLLDTAGYTLTFEPEFQQEVWHFDTSAASNIEPEIFWTVVQAANKLETLAIDYYSASSDRYSSGRKIDPLVIAEQGGSWLVAAYCHEKQRVLDFSLPAIEAAEPMGTHFARPDGFDRENHFESRFNALKGDEMHEVVIRVVEEKAEYFQRKTYHPSQENEQLENGDLKVRFTVSNLDDIAGFVRAWGPDVQVLRPEPLAERIEADLEAALQAYRGDE